MCDLGVLRRHIVSPPSRVAETSSCFAPVRIKDSAPRPAASVISHRPVNKYSSAIWMELFPLALGPRTKLNRSRSKTVSWYDRKFFKVSVRILMPLAPYRHSLVPARSLAQFQHARPQSLPTFPQARCAFLP